MSKDVATQGGLFFARTLLGEDFCTPLGFRLHRALWPVAALAACLALASDRAAATIPPWPDYQIGDRADADWISPMRLMVFDPDQREQDRRRAMDRIPRNQRALGRFLAPFLKAIPVSAPRVVAVF